MISGSPGFDNRVWLRAVTVFQRLPELLKRLDRVEKKAGSAQGTAEREGEPGMMPRSMNPSRISALCCSRAAPARRLPLLSR